MYKLIGNCSQEDLAKFGYRTYMKVENFEHPFIFWLPVGSKSEGKQKGYIWVELCPLLKRP
jgi:hypothetical protein